MRLYLSILLAVLVSFSQSNTKTVTPGAHYEAGGIHRLLFGDHWRDLWVQPLDVKVIDLDTHKGGLTPIKRGGGFQTKSLRFQAGDGKRYKFRSLDKDPSAVLPKELRETFAADVMQDQISTAHPYAPIIVVPMLDAVGVIHAPAEIIILPDHERLGEHREEFANLLGMLEEHPDDYDNSELNFAGADKLNLTYSLWKKMHKSSKHYVDQKAFLRARIMDVFFGDWDRHQDQWKWAGYEEDGDMWRWVGIPRDRDQPFAKYDGLFPWVAALAVPQIEGFSEDYPEIEDLAFSGRFVDRRFLNQLEKHEWDAIAKEIQSTLTDELIVSSVKQMPDHWYNTAGEELISGLKSRRDQLLDAINEYYEYMALYVWIYGTNDKEYVEIERVDDDNVMVRMYDTKKKNKKHRLIFERNVKVDETREIRILLDEDDDEVLITGDVASSVDIIIDAGKGKDKIVDKSSVSGFLGDETATYVYDSGKKTTVKGDGIKHIDRKFAEPDTITDIYEPLQRDYDYDWKGTGLISRNSDDGIVIEGGPILFYHSYKNNPYNYRLALNAAFATETGKGHLIFEADFLELIPGLHLQTSVGLDWLKFTRFYGLGNETVLTQDSDSEFYRFGQRFFEFTQGVEFGDDYFHLIFAGGIQSSRLELDQGSFLQPLNLLGMEELDLMKLELDFFYNSWRQDSRNPDGGFQFHFIMSYFPNVFDNVVEYDFRKMNIDIRKYVGIANNLNLALRAAGAKTWGKYPFFHSSFLGSQQLLRGYNRERFAGESMAVANAELRWDFANIKLLIPGRLGITAYGDAGRVFVRDDSSKKWHSNYGAGLFMSSFSNTAIINISIAKSEETTRFYFGLGFDF